MNGVLLLLGVSACFLLGYRLFAKRLECKLAVLLDAIACLGGRKVVA